MTPEFILLVADQVKHSSSRRSRRASLSQRDATSKYPMSHIRNAAEGVGHLAAHVHEETKNAVVGRPVEVKHEAVIEDRYGSPSSEEVLPVLSPVRLVLVRQPVHILGIAHR